MNYWFYCIQSIEIYELFTVQCYFSEDSDESCGVTPLECSQPETSSDILPLADIVSILHISKPLNPSDVCDDSKKSLQNRSTPEPSLAACSSSCASTSMPGGCLVLTKPTVSDSLSSETENET